LTTVEIDGSYGEGGGQILRTAIGLSALTGRPVHVYNIRANRPNPGLSHQHLKAVEVVARMCNAECEGLEIGSTELTFEPDRVQPGTYEIDIGTAGSVTLLLQAPKIAAMAADDTIVLRVRGGTDVKWSPPADYEEHVNARLLNMIGYGYRFEIIKRGHYPRGGGEVEAVITPPEDGLKPLKAVRFGEPRRVMGVSHSVRLPPHVAQRQATSAAEILREHLDVEITIRTETYPKEIDTHAGPGSGIVLWVEDDEGNRIAASALGEKGKPAEEVGREAAQTLLKRLDTGMALDGHMGDQILPFLALADGPSEYGVTEVDPHLTTNAWVVRKFLDVDIEVEGEEGEPGVVRVKP